MRNYKIEAIILKRRNVGEADKLLTIFTKQHGKMQVKAVGIRRITSRRSPHAELLNHSMLTLYKGKGIPIVTEATTVESFSAIKNSLLKVGFAYHICELIDGLCAENQENKFVFSLLHNTLDRLSKEEEILDAIHEFEIQLLTSLGFYRFSQNNRDIDTLSFIESILERKLKARKFLHRLS